MTDLLQELMDDVRADRMADLWTKYGRWVIYTAVSIIIVTALVVFWNHHKRETAMHETAIYFAASDALTKGDAANALKLLDSMSVDSKSPYYGLVLLKKAQSQQALGKADDARGTIAELAKRNDVYGDIGKILSNNVGDVHASAPLPFTLNEWAAWELLAKGQNAQAAEHFTALAKMKNVPASMHDRAQMMANYLRSQSGGTAHE